MSSIDHDVVRGLLDAAGRIVLHAGNTIAAAGAAHKLIFLESGVSALCTYTDAGARRITAFHFPGEFCNLHGYIGLEAEDDPLIVAITDCSFRVVAARELEEQLKLSASLRLHLFDAALREIRIARHWLLHLPEPALDRVANLLCELFDRQQASGIARDVIPLTQVDLADAAGLSPVHVNRTIMELRAAGVMVDNHHLQVADRKRLGEICGFDRSYLNTASPIACCPS